VKFKIEIFGRGGEIVIGRVKREFYDLMENGDIDIYDYAANTDYDEDNQEEELNVPEEFRPFEPGMWHECDDLAHECGAEVINAFVTVYDPFDAVVVDSVDVNELVNQGASIIEEERINIDRALADGDTYFLGQSFEKGSFSCYEFEDNEFDPAKLTFITADINGWELVTGILYNEVELEDLGEMSTTCKETEFSVGIVEKDDE